MRQYRTLATLSVVLLAGACSKKETPTAGLSDDLTKDLAAASATSSDLATAPKNYQRTRFVSDVERWKGAAPVKRTAMTMHHSAQPTAASQPIGEPAVEAAPEPVAVAASTTTAPVATETAPVLDNSVGDAPPPYHGPASSPSGSGNDGVIIADRGKQGARESGASRRTHPAKARRTGPGDD